MSADLVRLYMKGTASSPRRRLRGSGVVLAVLACLAAIGGVSEAHAQAVNAVDIYDIAPYLDGESISIDIAAAPGAVIPAGAVVGIDSVHAVSDDGQLARIVESGDSPNSHFYGTTRVDSGSIVYTAGRLPPMGGNFYSEYRIVIHYTVTYKGQSDGAAVRLLYGPATDTLVAGSDEAATVSGVPVLVDVLGNDLRAGGLQIAIHDGPSNGTADIHGDIIRYMPDSGFAGTDTLTYMVAGNVSGANHSLADIARVTFAVSGDALMAVDDVTAASRSEGNRTIDVSANDIGAAGATVEIVSGPRHGTAWVVDDNIVYDRHRRGSATDIITYRLAFGPHSDTARLRIEATPINPVIHDDRAVTIMNRTVEIDVAANDAFRTVRDRLADIAGPDHGQAVFVNPDKGPIRYTPHEGFVGADSFTYNAYDYYGSPMRNPATVDVMVLDLPFRAADDVVSVRAGQPTVIRVLDNDISADGATVAIVTPPSNGDASASGSVINYSPASEGTDIMTYSITRGASVDRARVFVTVYGGSSILQGVPVEAVTREHEPYTFDADLAGGQTATFGLHGEPDGATINATTGEFSWTPSEDQGGQTYTFRVTANDGGTVVDDNTVTITVTEYNPPPQITSIPGTVSTVVGIEYRTVIGATDTDTVGGLRYELGPDAPDGATINATTGEFAWTPGSGQEGNHTIAVRVWEGVPGDIRQAQGTFVVSVTGIAEDMVTTNEDESVLINVLANDGTPRGKIEIITDPLNGTAVKENNKIRYTPNPDHHGFDAFEYKIVRGTVSQIALVIVNIRSVDDPVTFEVPANDRGLPHISIPENQEYSFDINVTNPDGVGYALDIDLGDPPAAGAGLTQEGVFSWTPAEEHGPGTYAVAITLDPEGRETVMQTITLSVTEANQDPVFDDIDADHDAYVNEPFELDVGATDADDPVQAITYRITNQTPPGDPAGIDNQTGLITWIPDAAGNRTITVQASDDYTPNGTAEITLTVAVQEAPPLVTVVPAPAHNNVTFAVTPYTTDEIMGIVLHANGTVAGGLGPLRTNATGVPVTLVISDGLEPGTTYFYQFARSADANYTGDDVVSGNFTTTGRDALDISITVAGAPVSFRAFEPQTAYEGIEMEYAIPLANPDGQAITWTITSESHGAAMTADGRFVWTPGESDGGQTREFDLAAAAETNTVDETLQVAVIEINANPVFEVPVVPPAFTGEQFTLDLDARDADIPEQTISYRILAQDTPDNPAAIDRDTGVITWTPAGAGTWTMTVRASDDYAPNGIDDLDIVIVVTDRPPANTPPMAEDVYETVTAGKSVVIDLSAGGRIGDGQQAADTLAVSIPGQPSQGAADVAGTKITYTAGAGDRGTKKIPYTVTDDNGLNTTATISITVLPQETPGPGDRSTVTAPVSDAAIGSMLEAYMSRGLVVFAGVYPVSGDDAGRIPAGAVGPERMPGLSGFLHAGIMMDVTDAGIPEDTISDHTLVDLAGNSDDVAMSVFVREIGNVPPVLSPVGDYSTSAHDILTFKVTATDFGDEVSYTLSGAPDDAQISGQGVFSWMPESADVGYHTFTVTSHDVHGVIDTEDITVRVLRAGASNRPPVAPDVHATVASGGSVVIVPGMYDPDGDRVRITGATGDAGGTIILSDNSIRYIADSGAAAETVTYTVADAHGAKSTGMITITVR